MPVSEGLVYILGNSLQAGAPLSGHGIAFWRWMLWLEVDAGFADPSCRSWRGVCWAGCRVAVSTGRCSSWSTSQPCLLVWSTAAHSTHLEGVGHKFPASTAQVGFPEGINVLEKEPGLDISYNFLTISSSECAAQKKFKQRTTEETHCWPDCQQVPSMSSFSIFLFSASKC